VSAVVATDPIRLLAARSEHGYTDKQRDAVTDEPEAVSATVQRQITEQAARDKSERARAVWREHRDAMRQHIEQLTAERLGLDLRDDLRVLARQVERIDRRLARL
jgi:hypothetical protein